MLWDELKHLRSGPAECRRFGLLVGPILMLVGGVMAWRHMDAHPWLWGVGTFLAALALVAPSSLKWPYRAWMSLGMILGAVVSTLLLSIFYYLLLTPLGCLARLAGKDFLSRRLNPNVSSYWLPRARSKPAPPESYEQQF